MSLDDAVPEIDLVAAALRADSAELGSFVEALAVKLEEAVPGVVRVQRRREGLFGPKLVTELAVDAGEQRLDLRRAGSSVQTSRARVSGGIVLSREQLDMEAWLRALSAALTAQAGANETTRRALERLLNE